MLNILSFIESLTGGGAEKVLLNLVNAMDRRRFAITVQTLYPEEAGKHLAQVIRYRYCYPAKKTANELRMRLEAALGRKDIDVLLRKASAFLLPSLYEGMPLVMIESQSAGLPCITADTYSHEVDFGIGYVQWLSLKQSATEWADAVEKAVVAPRADKTAVERAIQKNGFDSRVFAERLCRLYENAMKRK